jgi:hypothetical protein
VYVAAFDLIQYEPPTYILLNGIEHHRMTIEGLGPFRSMEESYDLTGCVSVYVGDSPDPYDPTVATTVMNACYETFQDCVMTPAMSNSNAPVFNAVSPNFPEGAVNRMIPGTVQYSASPGYSDNGPVGWQGRIDFSFTLFAYITPSSV